jgi:hypothetical protein
MMDHGAPRNFCATTAYLPNRDGQRGISQLSYVPLAHDTQGILFEKLSLWLVDHTGALAVATSRLLGSLGPAFVPIQSLLSAW